MSCRFPMSMNRKAGLRESERKALRHGRSERGADGCAQSGDIAIFLQYRPDLCRLSGTSCVLPCLALYQLSDEAVRHSPVIAAGRSGPMMILQVTREGISLLCKSSGCYAPQIVF